MVTLKTDSEIAAMRVAGRVVAATLDEVARASVAGARLRDLDALAAATIAAHGAKPSFLGYTPGFADSPYPGVVCLSVNDEIVHAIPDGRRLRPGDVLSIDCGAYVDGWHADAAVTVGIGALGDDDARLVDNARRALDAGIAAARPGARMGDVSAAIEQFIRSAGYGTPTGFGGHGIGTAMHEDPDVPNTGRAGRGRLLEPGLVIAIEPMVIAGGGDRYRTKADGWTVVTADGSRAAHFEHSVAITASGPVVLTVP